MKFRPLLALSLGLFLLSSPWLSRAAESAAAAAAAQQHHPAKAVFPAVALPEAKARGQRAIDLLGARLPEIAAWYGKSPEEFRALLTKDHRLRIDRGGRLFVEDELEAPLAATPGEQSVIDGTLLPLDQTFRLHSRPGARRTIYLNFTGATLTGTAWNTTGAAITALPFDLDGIPYSFNAAEQQRIQYIWQRVAEDYAPFDVDVTTEAPPADVLTRSSGTDQIFGTTVLITQTTGVYSCSCGGVAYIGAFDEVGNTHKPALVFYNQLGGGNEKYVAEAISHEAGHNMGLLHDGYSGGGYYAGHGSGATGWAPIMGVGYYQPVVQWSKGEYNTANNVQDDYTVMASNGLPLRNDDHGNTIGTATALAGAAGGGFTSYGITGVIERPGDVDMFSFAASAGTVAVTLNPANRSPNLDAAVDLYNTAGTLLASANPTEALNATLSFVVPLNGTYYVAVRGVGKGDPRSNGYSTYGSLGNYALTVATLTAASQPPIAVLSATPTTGTMPLTVNFSAAGSSDPDGTIAAYQWTFGDGTSGTGTTASHVYTTAGTYSAQLTVIDNLGLSTTKSVTITVNPLVAAPQMHVSSINMSFTNTVPPTASARVIVVDGAGRPVNGAAVTGAWSGMVSGTVSGQTDGSGAVALRSPASTASGTFTFTVTGITRAGLSYQSASNVETADSITR